MPSKKWLHDRQYDVVVLGATGYTGLFTAQHIAAAFPTDLRWAIAGRSRVKLDNLAAELKARNPDRIQPAIEVCGLDDAGLAHLAKSTFALITAVGPYCLHGEQAFKACAESGTHYFDVTGEVPWVKAMIDKYEGAARDSGALMFPQVGFESAPSDLISWSLASVLRKELRAPTRDVTLSVDMINVSASGGTLDTVFTVLDKYSSKELAQAFKPFALSPVPNPTPPFPKMSLFSRLTGLVSNPRLGLLTTSIGGRPNIAIVERSWGLLSATPSRKGQSYGPNFTFAEYRRAHSRLSGIAVHVVLTLGAFLLVMLPRPVKALLRRLLYQPGEGPSREEADRGILELRAFANPDLAKADKQAYCRATFRGSPYLLAAILAGQAALTVLEDYDSLQLQGGVYTAACLGQPLTDRLSASGFKIESRVVPV